MAGTNRVTLRLSERARTGWERVCLAHGVSMTALAEAMGEELFEHGVTTDLQRAVIERARQIDMERRSRRWHRE